MHSRHGPDALRRCDNLAQQRGPGGAVEIRSGVERSGGEETGGALGSAQRGSESDKVAWIKKHNEK